VPEPSISEIEVAIGKLKRYQSPGADQFPAEMIQAGEKTLHSKIHKQIKLIWNKGKLPTTGRNRMLYLFTKRMIKLSVVIIGLLPTSYNILSTILLSRLMSYADEIIGDHQCRFRHNRSKTDQIFYTRQILGKKRGV
jgi:hypothetical protein